MNSLLANFARGGFIACTICFMLGVMTALLVFGTAVKLLISEVTQLRAKCHTAAELNDHCFCDFPPQPKEVDIQTLIRGRE